MNFPSSSYGLMLQEKNIHIKWIITLFQLSLLVFLLLFHYVVAFLMCDVSWWLKGEKLSKFKSSKIEFVIYFVNCRIWKWEVYKSSREILNLKSTLACFDVDSSKNPIWSSRYIFKQIEGQKCKWKITNWVPKDIFWTNWWSTNIFEPIESDKKYFCITLGSIQIFYNRKWSGDAIKGQLVLSSAFSLQIS